MRRYKKSYFPLLMLLCQAFLYQNCACIFLKSETRNQPGHGGRSSTQYMQNYQTKTHQSRNVNGVNATGSFFRVAPATADLKKCISKKAEANKCNEDLLPGLDFGIPSNRNETDTACSAFTTAIRCVTEWADNCLSEAFLAKMAPAIETYAFICKDELSRARYYQSGTCLKKITPGFDECADKVEDQLKELKMEKHDQEKCCHQRSYLMCVYGVLLTQKCNSKSVHAILEIARLTIGFHPSQLQKNNNSQLCIAMTEQECEDIFIQQRKNRKTAISSAVSVKENGLPELGPLIVFVMIIIILLKRYCK